MKRALCVAALASALTAGPALAQSGVEIGTLTCSVKDISNMVVYTKERFDCKFQPASGDTEYYTGSITQIGLNLSIKKDFTIVWSVLAPTDIAGAPGPLSGTYAGVGADVSLGAGVGAKVLVGGGDNSFTLQPVSVAGVVGGGASLGVQKFKLE
jgi:hypothetical protein